MNKVVTNILQKYSNLVIKKLGYEGNYLMFVVYYGDIEVGHFSLNENPKKEFPQLFYKNDTEDDFNKALCLNLIYIKSNYRGMGYMNKAMQYIENWAKKKGFRSILLYPDNESEIPQSALINIYESMGYHPTEADMYIYQKML